MASEQVLSTGDLRSHSVEHKRDTENKQKWSKGESWGPGRPSTAHARPAKAATRQANTPRQKRSNKELGVAAAKLSQRREILDTDNHLTSDSSADEDIIEPTAAVEPDADIAYSYDAQHGPSHGSQVLSVAITKAVERYENTVTENIVDAEYELVDDMGEVVPKPTKKSPKRGDAAVEGFVLV